MKEDMNFDELDFDFLEDGVEAELNEQFGELEVLKKNKEEMKNPARLGKLIEDVVTEQFYNQLGIEGGRDFIEKNGGKTLDLRDDAHIQTTENFAKGKIADHNTEIDYSKRYSDWQGNFEKDNNGNIITHTTRTGAVEANLRKGARAAFDKDRPTGSKERNTDMDHTISAAEIIRDPGANAHLTKEEQIKFANSDENLYEMDASLNKSKSDLNTEEWLNNPNSKGQKPEEIFNISKAKKKEMLKKNKDARKEYEKKKQEGEKRSIEAGKLSQKKEAIRIGKSTLKAVVMGLLAAFLKDVIKRFVVWIEKEKRSLESLGTEIKNAVKNFVGNIKEHLLNAADTMGTTILSAIYGPIVGLIKKAWIFIKQGWNSLKQAYAYIKDPQNSSKPFSILMLEVGKIFVAGISAGGAIVLSEVIEKGLTGIAPVFATPIPMLGSLASVIGLFGGALVSGIIGALCLNFIDRLISKKLEAENRKATLNKQSEIMQLQVVQTVVAEERVKRTKDKVENDIKERHAAAGREMKDILNRIISDEEEADTHKNTNKTDNTDNTDELLRMQRELDGLI